MASSGWGSSLRVVPWRCSVPRRVQGAAYSKLMPWYLYPTESLGSAMGSAASWCLHPVHQQLIPWQCLCYLVMVQDRAISAGCGQVMKASHWVAKGLSATGHSPCPRYSDWFNQDTSPVRSPHTQWQRKADLKVCNRKPHTIHIQEVRSKAILKIACTLSLSHPMCTLFFINPLSNSFLFKTLMRNGPSQSGTDFHLLATIQLSLWMYWKLLHQLRKWSTRRRFSSIATN